MNEFTSKWLRDYERKHDNNKNINQRVTVVVQQMDKKPMVTKFRKETMALPYRLRTCKIVYFCQHGQELDKSDNQGYSIIKVVADALVALGFARTDKEFETKAHQRMDDNTNEF